MPRANLAGIVLGVAIAIFAVPLLAAEPAALSGADAARLRALEREIEQQKSESERLRSQGAAAERALNAVRGEMIAVAKDIQDQERSVTILENRVAGLERDAAQMSETLKRRDEQLGRVLLAIERLALRPGDALTLSPLSPGDAVRSAILLRSALPSIKHSAATLQSELGALYKLRAEITEQKETAAGGAAALLEKRARLEKLVAQRAERQVALAARSEETDRRLEKMARDAQDLRELFVKLAEEKTRRDAEQKVAAAKRAEEEKTVAAKPAAPAPVAAPPQAPQISQALGTDHDVVVTRSFAKSRGTMPFPVAGALAGKYGEAAGSLGDPGLRAKGITIRSRAGAQVVAPFDGIVAFAGPFRGYGQLLIIEHSEGYHTLLAGMGRIDMVVGQRVLAGEPVGVMESGESTTLYVELRRDGQPINPLPWLADRTGKSSG